MKHMTLREIAQACKGTYFGSEESMGKEVSSVVIDSRKVEKDSLFVAIACGRTYIHSEDDRGRRALCTFRRRSGRCVLPVYPGGILHAGVKRSGGALSEKSGYQSSRNFRKCRKNKYKRDDRLRTGAEVQRAENGGKF